MDYLNQVYFGLPGSAYLRFIVIIVLAVLLKSVVSRLISKLAYRLLSKFSGNHLYDDFLAHVKVPLERFLLTILAYLAIDQISALFEKIILFKRSGPKLAEGTQAVINVRSFTLMELIDHIFYFLLIIAIANLLSNLLRFVFLVFLHKAREKKDKERQQLMPLLRDVLVVVVWAGACFVVLGAVFHVNVPTLIAGLGMGGIAVAFALKDSLENLLSSFMIMVDKPFIIGDWIKVKDVEGTVERIGFRSTHIRTFEQTLVSIPNRTLISDSLENYSERGRRRVKLTVGAEYGLSKEQLQTITQKISERIVAHPDTTDDPLIFLESFGDSAINIMVVYFVKVPSSTVFEKVKEQINYAIYEVMYQYGTGFPFPTQVQIEAQALNNLQNTAKA